MQNTKSIGWRSRFLLKNMSGDKRYFDENDSEVLRFDKEDFEEIPGRYFYNRGATYNQYLDLYWNDPQRNPSQFVTYDVRSAIHRARMYRTGWAIQQQTIGTFLRRFANITTELSSLRWYRSWWQRRLFHFQNRKQAKTRTLQLNQEDL